MQGKEKRSNTIPTREREEKKNGEKMNNKTV